MNPAIDPTSDIMDLTGASGAQYRFRRLVSPKFLPASGGNFVCVNKKGGEVHMIACGTASDLRHAETVCDTAFADSQADSLFIRLNISGNVRDQEHLDLVAQYAPPIVAADLRG